MKSKPASQFLRTFTLVVATLGVIIGATRCGRNSTDGKEIARVTSPDNKVDAVLIEVPTGATVPALGASM